jgi:hypothetical protein
MKKLWELFKAANPTVRIVYAVFVAVVIGLLIWLASAVVYRLFYQGQDLKKAQGNAIVATEQQKAEGNIATAAMGAMKERDVYHETVRTIVTEGRSNVNDAWKGETVGDDVDRAGADALCRLHNSLCRQPPAAPVQQVR